MGLLRRRVCFTGELPAVETVISELERLTGEQITYEYREDGEGIFAVEVSSETIAGGFTLLLPTVAEPFYEPFCGMGIYPTYLLDAVSVVLQTLGGTDEYASSVPAAAQQPWQLAKDWYQKG